MKKTPKISVILTSFNHAKYINEAIDSVINQTFTDFELIILDDCSSDNSWEIINDYTDSRIKTFRSQEQGQVVSKVNNAIPNLAIGEYIAIHHSDDIWELDKLEKQVVFLDTHTEIGAIFTNTLPIAEDSSPLTDEKHFYFNIFNQPNRTRHEWLRFFFSQGNGLCHPSILIRKKCYEDCGLYRYGMAQLPDLEMWIRLCMKYEIHVLPERLVKFRVRDNEANASGNRPETRIRSAYEHYKLLQEYRAIVRNDEIFKIFPDFISYDRGKNTDPEYVLARVCLEPSSFFLMHLLGIEILFDILNNARRRLSVEKTYGFSQTDFVAYTGQYDIFAREDVSNLLANISAANSDLVTAKSDLVASKEEFSLTNAKNIEQINILNLAVTERNEVIARLLRSIKEIRESTSWRITGPLRSLVLIVRNLRRELFSLPHNVRKNGGLLPAFRNSLRSICNEKPRNSTTNLLGDQLPLSSTLTNNTTISIVPYYIDPKLDSDIVLPSIKSSTAVHLHLFYTEMLKEIVPYLNNIPVQYDLYVSVPEPSDPKAIKDQLNDQLTMVNSVIVEHVPNRGGNIAPLIIQFGKRLSKYEIFVHLHTKASSHNNKAADLCEETLSQLLGSPNSDGRRIAHIIDLLQTTAKIVILESHIETMKNNASWTVNYDLAKDFLEKYTKISINDFTTPESPEDCMFWSRSECLRDFLKLPLKYDDFTEEPNADDGTLVHVLEKLILIFAYKSEGQYIQILNGDSIKDYRQYEEQQDYSSSIIHSDIKVISYYLPQFHPIPENDAWHGKGFTEWTKVKAANPLFEGHYQQHIPHSDIGYYLLNSADTLRQQAEIMKKSGVHGQVFYHYWFSGKLILEEPAQLLLDAPDIQMPFCFCWANENWTRRWDGNENEILLGQNYSPQDARDFIRYLIPFFKDSRYIKLEDRPVLFVYRPSSIPSPEEYLEIWKKECAKIGMFPPYVVAVLTRGATNPKDFGMDAGVERVLHDWTEGVVPEIKQSLHSYQPLNGSVLSYDEVANFYMSKTKPKDYTYFRSLVPIWDNTARYGQEAYLLHGSTPQRFQDWMESTIAYSQSTLPSDRRFVLVNAWNEWAEGAHLEPDSRYGYSYLNSVGRALSGIPYLGKLKPTNAILSNSKVHLSFSNVILDQLKSDSDLKRRFIHCLSRSSIFNACSVSLNVAELMNDLPTAIISDQDKADFILELRNVVFFDPFAIEKMLQAAFAWNSTIVANSYSSDSFLIEVSTNNSVDFLVAYKAPLLLLSKTSAKCGYKNLKMRTDARCFVASPSLNSRSKKPIVTTIIRFHKTADLDELQNALYCLSAMEDCVVIPLIAAQDMSKQQIDALENVVNNIAWPQGYEPLVHLYQSQGSNRDLRSKMMNESLKKVKTRYAAFLDFDDLLMPHAYNWLIGRLERTNKAITFGRVYTTSYDSSTQLLVERGRLYEYGYSYEDFLRQNHAPLHSIMFDLERLDLSAIVYFDDHRYMEDYFLTLQLITKDNTDWDSLKENFYVGDYIHSIDRSHTLAFTNEQERMALLTDTEYMICERRICSMRESLLQRDVDSTPA